MTVASQPLPVTDRRPDPSNLIAIASGKGGVGKTWFAVTLAHAYARLGKRVLLFDGDLGLANVDIQLGLSVRTDLSAVAAGRIDLHAALTRYDAGGFDIAAGQSGSGSLANLHASRLESLRTGLFDLSRRYDRMILDLGAGVDSTMGRLISDNGTLLVLAVDEPTSLTDAYAMIKMSRQRQRNLAIHVVINMAQDQAQGLRTYEKLKKACVNFLQFTPPLAGIVQRDAKVQDAIRHQTASLIRHPSATASMNVETIAATLPPAK